MLLLRVPFMSLNRLGPRSDAQQCCPIAIFTTGVNLHYIGTLVRLVGTSTRQYSTEIFVIYIGIAQIRAYSFT